jgi:hypothetical protein
MSHKDILDQPYTGKSLEGELAFVRRQLQSARARLQNTERERDEARANYAFMVERAINEKLDGYRELGSKCAELERERDTARGELAKTLKRIEELKSAHDRWATRVEQRLAQVELERDEAVVQLGQPVVQNRLTELVQRGVSVDFRADGDGMLVRLTELTGKQLLIGEAHVEGNVLTALRTAATRMAPLPLDMSREAVANREMGEAIVKAMNGPKIEVKL